MEAKATTGGSFSPSKCDRTYGIDLLGSIGKEQSTHAIKRRGGPAVEQQHNNEDLLSNAANNTPTEGNIPKIQQKKAEKSTIFLYIALLVLFYLLLHWMSKVPGVDGAERVCTHTTGRAPIRPYPNLSFCTPYIDSACCTAAMDAQASTSYYELVPNACADMYPELMAVFCHACDTTESTFVSVTTDQATGTKTTTVTLCKSFAENLWLSSDLTKASRRFDNCGLQAGTDDKKKIVTPSVEYANLSAFLAMLSTKVPNFFSASSVNDPITFNVAADNTNCFTSGTTHTHTTHTWVAVLAVAASLSASMFF